MCSAPSNDHFAETPDLITKFEQVRIMVESEFDVEEGFVEHGVPTFYVKLREDSKEAFLRLTSHMNTIGLIPVLRGREEKVVLQAIPKPTTRPSRNLINVVLLLATMGTILFAGLGSLQSPDVPGAVMFMGAIMAILGSHEMGHKLLADKHDVEATYPYFIPGPPPIGTFGAVIQQKSLPPNRDALFDIGFTGPVMGFIVTVIVAFIGVQLSVRVPEAPEGAWFIPAPLLFRFFTRIFPPSGTGDVIMLHPVAFAAWVGMLVTMLNLVPTGMFDGGHVARSLAGRRAHQILSYLGIILLLIIWYPMAIIALFLSMYRHPGPLDDISKVTTRRKLAALGLIAIFVLCVPWPPVFPL